MPVFAALLKLVYRRRLYVEHLVFALYFHAFVFLVGSVAALPSVLRVPPDTARWAGVLQFAVPVYFFLALRNVYGTTRWGTVARMVVVGLGYLMAMLVGVLVAFLLSVLL